MPSYLDFNTTKNFRDNILKRNLSTTNGPSNFSGNSYLVQNLNDFQVINSDDVEVARDEKLLLTQTKNTFKPKDFFINEELRDLPRQFNLTLYYTDGSPYFVSQNHTLVGIMRNENYENESELFKFAAKHIRDNKTGPVLSRIQQNLERSTVGRFRLLDALNGSTSTAINLVTGKEPLIQKNYQITVASSILGKGIDFLQTVSGVEFPFSEIPGDYLSNPSNPVNYRPETNVVGNVLQDITGALGSLVGIQRRPKRSSKPSDLFVKYLGEGQKQTLFNLLSFSKYAPNYTTSARSQQSSKLFSFTDNFAGGVKNLLGLEAPSGVAYVGDDRSQDVHYASADLNDRIVRSNYYLSVMFDPIQAELFKTDINVSEGGSLSGKLTWTSKKSQNKLGENNQEYNSERSQFEDTLSTAFTFREDSILAETQRLLDSLPSNGGEARSHVANVIDQTSRVFREGDQLLSRGSAIKYVNKFTGEESGVEYCRVWTKDRPYFNNSDTMKRNGNIRKFESSVMSTPWNLNIGPISNGNKGFDGSTNIFPKGDGFYAKKYMFSIENLAWKTSNKKGFRTIDLPFCERGPNEGRVMWFPPYDLKISETNNARWESNMFLGRPEPIYTYQNTERSGTIGFKVVVDHPSILNLLVREHFKNMSDVEADNYINAFFAGCEELDFYTLIRTYTTLDSDDIQNLKAYLNDNKDSETIKKYRVVTEDIKLPKPNTSPDPNSTKTEKLSATLFFPNDEPSGTSTTATSIYGSVYSGYVNTSGTTGTSSTFLYDLNGAATTLLQTSSTGNSNVQNDKKVIFGKTDILSSETGSTLTQVINEAEKGFTQLTNNYNEYSGKITKLKDDITNKNVQEIKVVFYSTTSFVADETYNLKLSLRRSHSVLQDVFDKLSNGKKPSIKNWPISVQSGQEKTGVKLNQEYSLKDFGYESEGKLIIEAQNIGENLVGGTVSGYKNIDCHNKEIKTSTVLKKTAPITFYCRQTTVKFDYTVSEKQPTEVDQNQVDTTDLPKTRLEPIPGLDKLGDRVKKPPIDVMKRIIMKTLSECYYFKKLEENSPIVFKSLKEKLKYFHPGFHSTTPEGLNARLTFLQQCIRPGDTIPIKGISDNSDLPARNTSFGPPPICVLRIGDFYHSKIIIRDVNISYDESVWDMNPEGIGVQPMLANVTLQVSFIGGQGMESTVERLQNALSSNFYANTEMYDERSISTNTMIAGESASGFTKSFLDSIQKSNPTTPEHLNDSTNAQDVMKGWYIGTYNESQSAITYTNLIKDIYNRTEEYFSKYQSTYNVVNKRFGKYLTSLIFSNDYRTIKNCDVYTGSTSGTTELLGIYPTTNDIGSYIEDFKTEIINSIDSEDITTILGFDSILKDSDIITKSNRLIRNPIKEHVKSELDILLELKEIKDLERLRNNLVSSIDRLNFISKNSFDGKIEKEGTKMYQADLSGFTPTSFYSEYDNCVDYLINNQPKLNLYLDNTIDFNSISLDTNKLSTILSVVLNGQKTKITDVYKIDTILFPSKSIEKMNKKFDEFIDIPKDLDFKLKKFIGRKNDKEITYGITSISEITDSVVKTDLTNVMARKIVKPIDSKLNYYKL